MDARVENLRALHDAEGRVQREAVIVSDFGWLTRQFLGALRFQGGQNAFDGTPKRLDRPYDVSLENLIELGEADAEDDRILGLQAELFSWLAVDCNYALSRERSVLNLRRVGRQLGLEDASRPLSEERAIQPGIALDWLRELRAALEPYFNGDVSAPPPAAVSSAVGAVDVTALDRDGARRLLRAMNVWRDAPGWGTTELASLAELRMELAKRSVELALAESLSDEAPRVRAAALDACVRLSENRLPRLLRAGLTEAEPEVVVRSLRLLRDNGIPSSEDEPGYQGTEEDYRAAWIDLVQRLLRVSPEGPIAVAGCQALAKITDAGFTSLRPEVWNAWWERETAAIQEAAEAAASAAP